MSVRRRRTLPRRLPLSAATVLTACTALLAVSLVPADAEPAAEPDRSTPASAGAAGQLLAIPGGNTFPVPAPYEVSFSDSWHACRDGCRRQHKGNDLMADEGTPIVAVESGVIAKVDGTDDGNGGLSVWLLGDSGVAYYYAHNSANLVAAGQQVARGQLIARVGHTGNARTTPPHIHFQINRCGDLSSAEPCTVDPYQPLHGWPQEQIDGGADALGLYTPVSANLRLRSEGGSPLPLDSYEPSRQGARDVPVAGDWNGDGRDTVGIYRPADATFHLRDDNGAALPPFRFGAVDDLPLAGDWDGDGRDTVGVYRPSEATFFLRDGDGRTRTAFPFGTPTPAGADAPQPVAGDWDGDRRDTVALFRPSDATFVARDDSGAARPPFRYGAAGDLPLAGDWDGDGRDTVGVYRSADASYHLQGFTDLPGDGAAEPAAAAGDVVPLAVPVPSGPVVFGPRRAAGARPVAGDWNGRDLVTLDDLDAIWGNTPDAASRAENLPLLNAAMVQSGVVTPARKAAFLSTIRNESGFRSDAVERRDSRYRGRGFIQLTGENNYRRAGAALGLDLVDDPDLVTNPLVSASVTSWYWTVARNINLAADRLDMAAVNIAVGYRPTALEDFERCADFIRALEWFNGGTLPDGVNCERSLAAITTAFATVVPESSAGPEAGSDVPPASVTDIPLGFPLPPSASPSPTPGAPPTPGPTTGPRPAPTTRPPSPTPTPTTGPQGSTTTTTTQPPSTTTMAATTTTGPPPTTTVPETTTSTEPPAPTTSEAPTTTEAPSPGG